MSDSHTPIDHHRYFNDPEYRKQILAEKNKKPGTKKPDSDSLPKKKSSKILIQTLPQKYEAEMA